VNAALPPPRLSIVIPVMNEAGNITPLVQEIIAAMRDYEPIGERFEILYVDDGSTDTTVPEIRAAMVNCPQLRLIRHPHRLGTSTAIRNGVRLAQAAWVLTIDGDRQNDPADIPRLCNLGWKQLDGQLDYERRVLVAGIRTNRRDTLTKRLASRFANGIRKTLLRDDCPDTACCLKLFSRSAYLEIPFFNGLHRFMPALFKLYGHELIMTPINDRPRTVGVSKSDILGRGIKGLFDLLGVLWLMRRTPKPAVASEEQPKPPL